MCKLDELTLSSDHRAVQGDGGVWIELSDAIERIAFLTPRCEGCPKGTFLSCVQLDTVDRQANCEMIGEVKLFEDMSTNPMPQPGKLYEDFLAKNAPKPEVTPGSVVEPEPPKRATLAEKVRGVFKF